MCQFKHIYKKSDALQVTGSVKNMLNHQAAAEGIFRESAAPLHHASPSSFCPHLNDLAFHLSVISSIQQNKQTNKKKKNPI